jgi:hypothetical protein
MGFCSLQKCTSLDSDEQVLWLSNGIEQKSSRQGCPSTPYIFLPIVDVLKHMLQDERHGVQRMQLLNGKNVISYMFTNNTTLYLVSSKGNIDKTMIVFQKFKTTIWAKSNLNKIIDLWMANKYMDWAWGK